MFKHFSIFCAVLAGLAVLVGASNAVAQTLPDTGKASVVWQYFNTKQYDGDKRAYTEEDLYPPYAVKGQASDSVVAQYLRLLRNEIYARKGKVFKDKILQALYEKMDWYIKSKEVTVLNKNEKNNIEKILKTESKVKTFNSENNLALDQGIVPEKYEVKTLIEAKWGEGVAEVWLDSFSEPGPAGPSDFAVAIDGSIYILDNRGKNVKILKYNKFGTFIDEMYYYKKDEIKANNNIKQLVVDRRMYDTYAISIDENNYIYLVCWPDPSNSVKVSIRKFSWKSDMLGEYNLPNNTPIMNFNFRNNKISLRYENDKMMIFDLKNISKNNVLTKQEIPINVAKSIKGQVYINDINGNYYVDTFDEVKKNSNIYKYSSQGALITIIDYKPSIFLTEYLLRCDDHGNLYCMDGTAEGLRITKWEISK